MDKKWDEEIEMDFFPINCLIIDSDKGFLKLMKVKSVGMFHPRIQKKLQLSFSCLCKSEVKTSMLHLKG